MYNKYSFLFSLGFLFAQCDGDDWTWRWLDDNDLFDSVCGISYKGTPISIGVFFDINLVLTSATPIQQYLDNYSSLKVHSIYGGATTVHEWNVTCADTSYAQNRKDYWIPLGLDDKHSGGHDLAVLFADSPKTYDLAPEASNASSRHAYSMFLATPDNRLKPTDFAVAGFGYLEEEHVKTMNDLEVEIYTDSALVDCDDYIPRDWGRFICIQNINNASGVQSGSPLYHRGLIYGIGCFALEKGEDKIFVFTDVREYVYNLYYCEIKGQPVKWHSRYWKTPRPPNGGGGGNPSGPRPPNGGGGGNPPGPLPPNGGGGGNPPGPRPPNGGGGGNPPGPRPPNGGGGGNPPGPRPPNGGGGGNPSGPLPPNGGGGGNPPGPRPPNGGGGGNPSGPPLNKTRPST